MSGVNLAEPLPADVAVTLHDALYEHGLLLFRDQDVTPADEIRFARLFTNQADGSAMSYTGGSAPQNRLPDFPEVAIVGTYDLSERPFHGSRAKSAAVYNGWHPEQRAWHNDGLADTWPPPDLTTMRCVQTPSRGGETLFACSVKAASLLPELDPPPEQVRVRYRLFSAFEIAREGTHLLWAEGAKGEADTVSEDGRHGGLVNVTEGTELPLVVREKVSGKRSMVGTYHVHSLTAGDRSLSFDDANEYLRRAWAPGLAPELVYKHTWRVGDVVAWSNRLVIHTATSPANYAGEQRLHTRVRMRSTEEHAPRAWAE